MAAFSYDFAHPRLGRVHCITNPRARNFVFRYASCDELRVTCPPGARRSDVDHLLLVREDALLRLRAQAAPHCAVQPGFRVEMPYFAFRVETSEGTSLRMEATPPRAPRAYRLLLPVRYEVSEARVQAALRQTLLNALRTTASWQMPLLVEERAAQCGFRYGAVHVRKTLGRWGSCSARGDLSFSLFLMMLPAHLVDYVVCHELCHTVEMNHGPRFWQLLQRCLGCDPRLLRKELQPYGVRLRALFG